VYTAAGVKLKGPVKLEWSEVRTRRELMPCRIKAIPCKPSTKCTIVFQFLLLNPHWPIDGEKQMPVPRMPVFKFVNYSVQLQAAVVKLFLLKAKIKISISLVLS